MTFGEVAEGGLRLGRGRPQMPLGQHHRTQAGEHGAVGQRDPLQAVLVVAQRGHQQRMQPPAAASTHRSTRLPGPAPAVDRDAALSEVFDQMLLQAGVPELVDPTGLPEYAPPVRVRQERHDRPRQFAAQGKPDASQ
jgi:hypothetical protein